MRRRKLLVMLVGLAVVGAVGMAVLWPRADRITQANCDQIREGMTRSEVETILGPVGDYSSGPTEPEFVFVMLPAGLTVEDVVTAGWIGDTGSIDVGFDRRGKVAFSQFTRLELRRLSPLANLLWRAKRQWHRWFP